MKTVKFPGAGVVELAEAATPVAGENQALLKTRLSGISAGTERMWFDGSAPALKSGRKSYPYTPGYELVGEVVADAPGLGLTAGERVFAMKPHGSHAVIGANDVWFRLPEHITDEEAVFIALTGTALHSIHRSGVTVGDRCAVVGMGVLGLIMVEILAKGMQCDVTAVTGSADKAELASERGASDVFVGRDMSAFKGALHHACFDASGVSNGIKAALSLLANQGVVVGAGFYTEPFSVDGEQFFAKEARMVSVRATGVAQDPTEFNRWTRSTTMQLAAKLVRGKIVNGANLISDRVKPGDLEQIYTDIRDRKASALQVIIDWSPETA